MYKQKLWLFFLMLLTAFTKSYSAAAAGAGAGAATPADVKAVVAAGASGSSAKLAATQQAEGEKAKPRPTVTIKSESVKDAKGIDSIFRTVTIRVDGTNHAMRRFYVKELEFPRTITKLDGSTCEIHTSTEGARPIYSKMDEYDFVQTSKTGACVKLAVGTIYKFFDDCSATEKTVGYGDWHQLTTILDYIEQRKYYKVVFPRWREIKSLLRTPDFYETYDYDEICDKAYKALDDEAQAKAKKKL